MSRQLSTNAKQAIFAQQTSEIFAILLTITHPDLTNPIRLSSDSHELLPTAGVRGIISRGQEYIYLPFSVSLPSQDETGVARAQISIDNIDRTIVQAVRQANSSLAIKIEVILVSDPDNVEISIDNFKLQKVTYDAFTVGGELSLEYYDLEPFPYKRFTPSGFPGIF